MSKFCWLHVKGRDFKKIFLINHQLNNGFEVWWFWGYSGRIGNFSIWNQRIQEWIFKCCHKGNFSVDYGKNYWIIIQTRGLLSSEEFRVFWVAAESAGGKLRVRAGRGGKEEAFMSQGWDQDRAANQLSAKFSQSHIRPILGPSPGWKCLLALSHLRHY